MTSTFIHAGAWIQKKQGYYLKVSGSYLHTTCEYDFQGNRKDILEDFSDTFQNGAYDEVTLKSYFEYGILPRLTLVAELPFKIAASSRTEVSNYFEGGSRDTSYTTAGFGDLKLQGRWGIIQNGTLVLSFQPGVKIPLYSNDPNDNGPQLGTGDVDIEGGLMFGASFYPAPLYVSSESGYRVRNGPLHDEVYANLEAGLTFTKVNFKAELRGVKNTTTPPDIYGGTLQLPLPGGGGAVPIRLYGDQDYLKLNLEGVYKISRNWGVSAELIHMIAGKNIIAGTMFQTGIVLIR